MEVPLLDLKAQYARIRNEIRAAIDEVLESQHFILGPQVEALERAIADYTGSKYAIGVSSGTDGLLVALMALNIQPGDEVITTPFSFFASAGVIARLRAKPVFIDIDPLTFNMDPSWLERAVTIRTKAVMPVHLFGQCADMDLILDVAGKYKIPVIEDACQSIGAEYKGRKSGTLGVAGVFSFFPSKNLGGYGDGGMVVTNDRALNEKIRLLRQHGSAKTYHHKLVGGNFRLDSLQAAVLRVKLNYLDEWSATRRANAARYTKRFSETGLQDNAAVLAPLSIREKSGDVNHHIYHQYTIRAERRDELQAALKSHGIGTSIYYPMPLHLQDCFAHLGYKYGDFPEAEKAAAEGLSLPMYPELSEDQQEYVVGRIMDFYSERKA